MTKKIFLLPAFLILALRFSSECFAQNTSAQNDSLRQYAPKVFLDCQSCDEEYVRTEITFVNYVRDRHEANIHILITDQENGSGGDEFTFTFIGQKNFSGMNDTLKYNSRQSDTDEIIREGMVHTIKLGLMRYIARTSLAEQMDISFDEEANPLGVADKWKSWVFTIGTGNHFNGEESRNSLYSYGYFSADKVTPEWKISFGINASYGENNFKIDDTTTIKSITRSQEFESLIVKSLSNHWSLGGWGNVFSSTYSNIDLYAGIFPAIEYDLFPYSESTHKQLRFLLKSGPLFAQYSDTTIYDKTQETLFNARLSATLDVKEKWGSVQSKLEGSVFLHDLNKNRLEWENTIYIRLFKGFSIRIDGQIALVHDQLSLPKEGASTEEILLQRKQLATQYEYFGSLGISYTFGSIYNNVVNPRFGD